MANFESILVSNLTETLRQLQRYMVWSLGASVFFLVLAILKPSEVELPTAAIPLAIPMQAAAGIAVTASWIFGALASFNLSRTDRIIHLLGNQKGGKELLAAVLTYPSIPTTRIYGPRIGLAILPPLFMIVGLIFLFGIELLSYPSILGVFVLVVPNITLAFQLRTAVGGGIPDHYGD